MPDPDKDDIDTSSSELSEDMSLLVLEMHGDIKKIEQHMNEITNLIESNAEDIDDNSEDISKIENQVDSNETKIKVVYGVASFMGAVFGAGAAALPTLI